MQQESRTWRLDGASECYHSPSSQVLFISWPKQSCHQLLASKPGGRSPLANHLISSSHGPSTTDRASILKHTSTGRLGNGARRGYDLYNMPNVLGIHGHGWQHFPGKARGHWSTQHKTTMTVAVICTKQVQNTRGIGCRESEFPFNYGVHARIHCFFHVLSSLCGMKRSTVGAWSAEGPLKSVTGDRERSLQSTKLADTTAPIYGTQYSLTIIIGEV